MKRIISLILAVSIVCILFPARSEASQRVSSIEKVVIDGDVYYIETVISEKHVDNRLANLKGASKTKTATKTVSYKDAHQKVLWSVSVTATFTYNNKTSKCNSCSHQASSNHKKWSIKESSSSYSGNSATAKATAKESGTNGKENTLSVTISCSSSGTIN